MKEVKKVADGWADRQQYLPNLFVRYRGFTWEQWQLFWSAQDGLCAGCKGHFAHPFDKRSLVLGLKPEVDHDHVTGKIRGLLCRQCNDFLGKIQDNRKTLQNLVDYLKRNGDW